MSSSQRPYQGYPYIQPVVTDAPSISAATAARWQHLPRRQVDAVRGADIPERSGSSFPGKRESNLAPVVYIELPEASGSDVADRRQDDSLELQVIESNSTQASKTDPAPVVYIDLPEAGGSDVAQDMDLTSPEEEPPFVQDTIFYDPFENRRIDRTKEDSNESDDDSEVSGCTNRPQVPRRPYTLDLNGAGNSAGASTSYPCSSGISSLMSKEASIYGQTDSNGFPNSPIPVSQFPEPPPAYAEFDSVRSVEQPVTDQPRANSPPRTQVILPGGSNYLSSATTPIGMPNPERKYMTCQHCGSRVHTLVVKEIGTITHIAALACLMICVLPCVAFIYCTDYLKIKNHYCPNCNQIIAQELPGPSNKLIYIS